MSHRNKNQNKQPKNLFECIFLDPTDDRNQYPPMGAPYPPAAPGYGGKSLQEPLLLLLCISISQSRPTNKRIYCNQESMTHYSSWVPGWLCSPTERGIRESSLPNAAWLV